MTAFDTWAQATAAMQETEYAKKALLHQALAHGLASESDGDQTDPDASLQALSAAAIRWTKAVAVAGVLYGDAEGDR